MATRRRHEPGALLLAAVLTSGCATLSPEVKTALREPGQLSMLQAPPPLRDERRTVTPGDTPGDGAVIAGTAALLILTVLVAGPSGLLGAGGLGGLGGSKDQAVQVNAGSVEGVSPSDILSVAVQERLVALGYARPGFVPGVRVRFESRAEELPQGIAVSTRYVLKAQVDRVKVVAGGVPTRLVGSLTLFEDRRALLHSSCSHELTAAEARDLSRQDAWLALLRPCAAALVAPFEGPTVR